MSVGAAEARKFSQETIKRGIDQLQKEAAALGRPISVEDARKQVQAMLLGNGDSSELPELFV